MSRFRKDSQTISAVREHVLADLRERISAMEGGAAKRVGWLPFGVPEIDAVLPGGGLQHGALHEFAGGGSGTVEPRLHCSPPASLPGPRARLLGA
ncbi:hypothetical protein J2W42_000915 [Rhizobium tibeticum]|nr:hypothetical protein [Rhizobium tibeticum]